MNTPPTVESSRLNEVEGSRLNLQPSTFQPVTDIAISVRNVSKMYPLYARPSDRLKQSLWYALPPFLRGQPRQFYREFWALQDISFEVKKGEALGIIGRNGSGKSTLLQIIAGTLTPTHGEVTVNGRVAALLELGSGFNPEFTGRENVYLNGSILGFSRAEMDDLYDEIVAFADIGQFIDQPVKLYSSGMFVRLAFAVQACVEPDIFIVDEALAVGDVFFRQKCYDRMEQLKQKQTAILLVTHSLSVVEEMCQHGVLLDQGRTIFQGEPVEAVRQFLRLEKFSQTKLEPIAIAAENHQLKSQPESLPDIPSAPETDFWPSPEQFLPLSTELMAGLKQARCIGVALCDDQGQACHSFEQGDWADIYSEFEPLVDMGAPLINIIIRNDRNFLIHARSSLHYLWPQAPGQLAKNERVRFHHKVKLDVLPGEYTLGLEFVTISLEDYLKADKMSHEEITAKSRPLLTLGRQISFVVTRRHQGISLLGHGLCNLPGDCLVSINESF